ncbi:MAG: hypothetical protein WD602_04420 [Actinomycetota bacterium]
MKAQKTKERMVRFGRRAVPLLLAGLLVSGAAFASSGNHDDPPSTEDLVEQGLPSGSGDAFPGGVYGAPSADPAAAPAQDGPRAPDLEDESTGTGNQEETPAEDTGGPDDGKQLSAAKTIIANYHASKAGNAPANTGLVDGIPGNGFLDREIREHGAPGSDGSSVRSAGTGPDGSDGLADDDEDGDTDSKFPFDD